MADFFLMSEQYSEGVGGMGGWWVAGGENPALRHVWSSHDVNRHQHNGLCHIGRPQGCSVI